MVFHKSRVTGIPFFKQNLMPSRTLPIPHSTADSTEIPNTTNILQQGRNSDKSMTFSGCPQVE